MKSFVKLKQRQINRILEKHNYIQAATAAAAWINHNTIQSKGIVITSRQRKIYQEVTGYYIPTLLNWGMRDTALSFTRYLCDVQRPSGAWLSADLKNESVFNTGQVIRGLVEVASDLPEVQNNLSRGCEWLFSNMDDTGRLVPTVGTPWVKGTNSELIHLYCLPPIVHAAEILNQPDYQHKVDIILNYYLRNFRDDIENFNYLSHFYAYILDALLDLGERSIVERAMNKLEKYLLLGEVPAYANCHWTCSTGLFQLAIIWYKLGKFDAGNAVFDYAVRLQNPSGGWYGGYSAYKVGKFDLLNYTDEIITYFPDEEISWATKYFFDALLERQKLEYNQKAHIFLDFLERDDIKYQTVEKIVQAQKTDKKVLDVGCGKGRYLKKLAMFYPQNDYYGIDISEAVLNSITNDSIKTCVGTMQRIPFHDEFFDIVYSCEALEHAILIKEAVVEMVRVLKKEGTIVIIDKDQRCFQSALEAEWIDPKKLSTEQWLDKNETVAIFKECGLSIIRVDTLSTPDVTYFAFIGRKAA